MKTRIWRVRRTTYTPTNWYITWPDGEVSRCRSFTDAIERFDAAVKRWRREFTLS